MIVSVFGEGIRTLVASHRFCVFHGLSTTELPFVANRSGQNISDTAGLSK
jgi:hypothetical protein